MTEQEEWRAVEGFVGLYEVSDLGRVRSFQYSRDQPRLRRLTPNKDGHLRLGLSRGNKTRIFFVHRLVADAFIPNPEGHPIVRHWDDDPGNNKVENLRWGTVSDNWLDMVRNGNHRNARKTHCPRGHEYTPANTYVSKRGQRTCLGCRPFFLDKHRRDLQGNLNDSRHGTRTGYTYGCRCDPCNSARRGYP